MGVKGTWIRKKRISDEEWAEEHARIFGKRPEKEKDESGTDTGASDSSAFCPPAE